MQRFPRWLNSSTTTQSWKKAPLSGCFFRLCAAISMQLLNNMYKNNHRQHLESIAAQESEWQMKTTCVEDRSIRFACEAQWPNNAFIIATNIHIQMLPADSNLNHNRWSVLEALMLFNLIASILYAADTSNNHSVVRLLQGSGKSFRKIRAITTPRAFLSNYSHRKTRCSSDSIGFYAGISVSLNK